MNVLLKYVTKLCHEFKIIISVTSHLYSQFYNVNKFTNLSHKNTEKTTLFVLMSGNSHATCLDYVKVLFFITHFIETF